MALPSNAIVKAFNLGDNIKAERKLLKTFVNVGTKESPIWEILGKGVEDSSIEFSPDTSSVSDITGARETSVNAFEITQSFDPMTIRGGSMLQVIIEDIVARKAYAEFSNFEILLTKDYISGTPEGSFYAEVHQASTIYPDSLGGSSYNDMPITATFSDNKTLGSVKYSAEGVPTFTVTASAEPTP